MMKYPLSPQAPHVHDTGSPVLFDLHTVTATLQRGHRMSGLTSGSRGMSAPSGFTSGNDPYNHDLWTSKKQSRIDDCTRIHDGFRSARAKRIGQ